MSADQDISKEPPPPEAGIWVARCERGLSASEEEDFKDWLEADPRNPIFFEELSDTYHRFNRLRPAQPVAAKIFESSPHPRRTAVATVLRWAMPLAAAAAFVIAYVAYWRPLHYSQDAVTEIGHQRTMKLPDGSWIQLNTDTLVAVAYSPNERRIKLSQGEAHFTVAKNPDRPFIVEANGVAVRAVGTAFNIRLRQNASVEVLVTEGKVQVNDLAQGSSLLPIAVAHQMPVLAAGEKVTVTAKAAEAITPSVVPVALDEINRELAWQSRQIKYQVAPLSTIVAEFNRYNRHHLVIADPELAAKTFGGSFQADDPQKFVRQLQDVFPVEVVERGNETILRLQR